LDAAGAGSAFVQRADGSYMGVVPSCFVMMFALYWYTFYHFTLQQM
jgi:hypothetical protein